MRNLIVFMHCSLDGFVAGPSGEMDWIKVDDTMFEYAGHQTDLADTALYGRVTYQMMDSYWPTAGDQPNASQHDIQHSTWYNAVEKVVLSTTLQTDQLKNTTVVREQVTDRILQMKQREGKNILVFGSPTAVHTLMAGDLIDEYWLFVNPILLGEGIPLFKNLHDRVTLTLIESIPFASGVVCLHYKK